MLKFEPFYQEYERTLDAFSLAFSTIYFEQMTIAPKKGSKYLRKTLYQIILTVINNNPVFKKYYLLKISQGKGHRCAQGHCIRKLLRIIYHLLETGQSFDPALLR